MNRTNIPRARASSTPTSRPPSAPTALPGASTRIASTTRTSCAVSETSRRRHAHAPAFARDIEKILNVPAYNRYADKTQVFSFVENDDISRRGLHVQLVSRVARGIGSLLGLNCEPPRRTGATTAHALRLRRRALT